MHIRTINILLEKIFLCDMSEAIVKIFIEIERNHSIN